MLVESVLLKDHATYYVLQNARPGHSNPIIDQFAPAVLYVKMVALLDEALAHYIRANNVTIASGCRNDLHGRITTLANLGLVNADELHRIRLLRNGLAHQATTSTTWESLQTDTRVVHTELKALGLIGEPPTVESFGERGAPNFDHSLPGVASVQNYVIGARVNGHVAAEMTWSTKTYRIGWDEEKVEAAIARGECPPSGIKR
ncbi:MAG: hypothetical protein QM831_43900 [Kofleriaceae bacterium]